MSTLSSAPRGLLQRASSAPSSAEVPQRMSAWPLSAWQRGGTSTEVQAASSHDPQANQEEESQMRRECRYREGAEPLPTNAQVKGNRQRQS